jgi:hypothetical protein
MDTVVPFGFHESDEESPAVLVLQRAFQLAAKPLRQRETRPMAPQQAQHAVRMIDKRFLRAARACRRRG